MRYSGLKEPYVIFICNDMVALTTIYQIDAVLNIVLEYNVFFSKLKIKMIMDICIDVVINLLKINIKTYSLIHNIVYNTQDPISDKM
ncbi:MAG: hypothetical protein ACTHL3_02260 [Candidatus Nitrosocosmicus sp.]